MYLSSDSLRTRMSRIRSILNSSPSISSTVIVESAMEMTSSAERQTRSKYSCSGPIMHLRTLAPNMKAYRGPVTLFLIFKHVNIAAKCALVLNIAKVDDDDLRVCNL